MTKSEWIIFDIFHFYGLKHIFSIPIAEGWKWIVCAISPGCHNGSPTAVYVGRLFFTSILRCTWHILLFSSVLIEAAQSKHVIPYWKIRNHFKNFLSSKLGITSESYMVSDWVKFISHMPVNDFLVHWIFFQCCYFIHIKKFEISGHKIYLWKKIKHLL